MELETRENLNFTLSITLIILILSTIIIFLSILKPLFIIPTILSFINLLMLIENNSIGLQQQKQEREQKRAKRINNILNKRYM